MAKLAQIGDVAPCHGHTEWFTDLLELGTNPKRQRRRPLFNTSKNAPFRCRMRKLWPKQWWRVCWIRGWRDSWVGDELQLGEDHGVGVSSVTMSSSRALLVITLWKYELRMWCEWKCILVWKCKQKAKENSWYVVEIMALSFRLYFERENRKTSYE
jgi:hypothetical protein